jgi:methyl-accepting chemotaxis protein
MRPFHGNGGGLAVPSSLKTSAVNFRDATRQHIGQPTPYLSLPSRLSQIWFNRWTVLLLLVLVHFLITISSLNDGLGDAKTKALSACTKVEDIGSAMASMPHYLSVGVNSLAASGITNSVQALITILDMIITGVEQLILFFIHMLTDTYVCLLSMAIHGALNVTAAVVERTTEGLNDAIDGIANGLMGTADDIQSAIDTVCDTVNRIGGGIGDGVDGATSVANEATSAVGGVGSQITSAVGGGLGGLFGRDVPQPTALVLPAVTLAPRQDDILPSKPEVRAPIESAFAEIRNIDIDSSSFVEGINRLNDDLPTFDEIRSATNEAISTPFNLVREKLREAYGSWRFDETVFPVAQKEALSFCSENSAINDFFEALYTIARQAKITAIVVICILAVLACVFMGYLEYKRWKKLVDRSADFSQYSYDEIDHGYMWSRPYTASVGIKIAHSKRLNFRKPMLIRWCIAYATSLPALFVLSLAIAGFFSCLCQIVLLKTIERTIPELSNQVGDFAEDVVYTLGNVSRRWSDDANGVITSFNNDINDDIFGQVTDATSAVNDTLNTFTETMDQGLRDALGETAFRDAAAEVIRCIIGLKIEAVQKGLTWVHDHAKVEFPLFPADVYSMGASDSISGDSDLTTFLASPSSVTTDEITGAVLQVTTWLHNSIIQEALISTALLLVYILVVLIGVVYTLVKYIGPGGTEMPRGVGGGEPTSYERTEAHSFDSSAFGGDEKLGHVGAGHAAQIKHSSTRDSSHPFHDHVKH